MKIFGTSSAVSISKPGLSKRDTLKPVGWGTITRALHEQFLGIQMGVAKDAP